MRLWALRIAILAAFVVVSLLFGPRASAVLAARLQGPSPLVDLDRVGLLGRQNAPAWLHTDTSLVRSVLAELSPVLRRRVRQDDAVAQALVIEDLTKLSWVAAAALRPVHPDRLELALELRRPVLEVVPVGPAKGRVPAVFVAKDGRCIYRAAAAGPSQLPCCRLLAGPVPGSLPVFELGSEHPDPRVLAAAATAEEWRTEVRPALPAAPVLIEVDASNLGYRLVADRRYSEVRVALRRADGGEAIFGYGRAPGHPLPRVATGDKVAVLRKILERFPGLVGVDMGDLRFVNLWENWLRPRPRATSPLQSPASQSPASQSPASQSPASQSPASQSPPIAPK